MSDATKNPAQIEQVIAWLREFGDELFAYVAARVADPNTAEDILQEALLAAVESCGTFRGASHPQTWLTTIVRRKLVDHFRVQARTRRQNNPAPGAAEAGSFTESGHWRRTLGRWPGDPARELENKEFWRVFDECRSKLPAPVAEAFMLRELDQLDTEEICSVLDITRTNLSVRLHRARLALRECLERNWFTND